MLNINLKEYILIPVRKLTLFKIKKSLLSDDYLKSYRNDFGASVHNDKCGNPHKIKVFGIKQTNITPLYALIPQIN